MLHIQTLVISTLLSIAKISLILTIYITFKEFVSKSAV